MQVMIRQITRHLHCLFEEFFYEEVCAVKSRFLDMPIYNVGTADKFFCAIENPLTKRGTLAEHPGL